MSDTNRHILEVRQLCTGYTLDKGRKLISEALDLRLNAGELVAVMGPNGSGKSTLIRTLSNLQPALSGEVLLMGQPLSKYTQEQLARKVAVVLTDTIANENMTVHELVALGRHPHTSWLGKLTAQDEAVIGRALQDVSMSDYLHRTMGSLSDGEKQRVMIARALAQESQIIILDEPTAHLDIVHRYGIMTLLRNLAKTHNKAILLSIHELDLALQAADTLWLLHSKNAHVGRPEDFILNGLLQKVFYNDNLEFNVRTGSFKMKYHSDKSVQLQIDNDDIRHWTQVLLAKNGIEVDPRSDKLVAFKNGSWMCQQRDFPSLDMLLSFLLSSLK